MWHCLSAHAYLFICVKDYIRCLVTKLAAVLPLVSKSFLSPGFRRYLTVLWYPSPCVWSPCPTYRVYLTLQVPQCPSPRILSLVPVRLCPSQVVRPQITVLRSLYPDEPSPMNVPFCQLLVLVLSFTSSGVRPLMSVFPCIPPMTFSCPPSICVFAFPFHFLAYQSPHGHLLSLPSVHIICCVPVT